MTSRKAVGIVRVSQVSGREGESFASPAEQADRITAECDRKGLTLIETIREMDVSGGTPLDQRTGLRRAVEAVEAGEADVIVAAYFDRLVRSLTVQGELVARVEKAGGQVLAVDVGQVTNGSAGQWLSGTALGMMSEYQRRSAAERYGAAQARAVARGVAPWPRITAGYLRGKDGRLEPDPKTADVVVEAFRMRAAGATVLEVRAHLARHGVKRSQHGVGSLLTSRVVLGEIHFGKLHNLQAHPPIVDRTLWERVQSAIVPRGGRNRSDRLLARLGVLRCGTCGARMVVGMQTQHGRRYPFYRCPPNADCPRRMAISATIVETLVIQQVREALADVEGRASVEANARQAEQALEHAQAALEGAIRAFGGLEDEQAARERLAELRAERDEAGERVSHLSGQRVVVALLVAKDWELLTLDERRTFIRATVAEVRVAPGRGVGRVSIQMLV